MHDIDPAAIDAQMAELFGDLSVLGQASAPARILRGQLIRAPGRAGWLAQARDLDIWADDAARGHMPATAADLRRLATRCRNIAEGQAIRAGETP